MLLQIHHLLQVRTECVELAVNDERVRVDWILGRPFGWVYISTRQDGLLFRFVLNDAFAVDVKIIFDVDKRCVRNVVIKALQNFVEYALPTGILQVVWLLHFVFVVLVEHVCM